MRWLLISGGLMVACGGDRPPPGVTDLHIETPLSYHEREGFVPIVPPVHLPSSSPDQDQVEVWMKLPPGAQIELESDPLGQPTLRFPAGTIAERVEFAGQGQARRIVDIRGTRIGSDLEQTFYVYRPTRPHPNAPLFGVAWSRHDPQAHAAATDRLVAMLAQQPRVAAMSKARQRGLLQGVRTKNRCAGCHPPARPDNESPGEHGIVDRGTDRSGFFTPQTLLRDDVPLEAYGAYDRSWSDPTIEIRCGPAIVTEPGKGRRCPDGTIARGRLRAASREPNADARVAEVCESRAWILAHLSPAGRSVWSAQFEADGPCKIN